MFRIVTASLGVLALGSCAHMSIDPRLTAGDVAAICQVTRNLNMGGFQPTIEWETGTPFTPGEPALEWIDLPRTLDCPDGRRVLARKGYGDFISSYARSTDGSVIGIGGGYQYASLWGGGGECFFRRSDDGYRLIGCQETWAS